MILTDPKSLAIVSKPILNEHAKRLILNDLWAEIERHENAVGLAAIQIGYSLQAFIVKIDNKRLEFINPEYVTLTPDGYEVIEGCLSIPNQEFTVWRSRSICLRDDINGQQVYDFPLSVIIQHEMDHLAGRTLLDTGTLKPNDQLLM